MKDALITIWSEIAARPDGPLAMRFYVQPLMATILAIRDGLEDARAGHPPYFWSLFTDPVNRRERLQGGWKSVGKIFVFATLLDLLYQVTVFGGLRPLEGLVVAIALAILPYVLLRGPANRLVRRGRGRPTRETGVG